MTQDSGPIQSRRTRPHALGSIIKSHTTSFIIHRHSLYTSHVLDTHILFWRICGKYIVVESWTCLGSTNDYIDEVDFVKFGVALEWRYEISLGLEINVFEL